MKGYVVNSGYMGYIADEGRYILFATEDDYVTYMEDYERACNMTMEELLAEIERR